MILKGDESLYSVVVIDDNRIAVEAIVRSTDWDLCGCQVAGSAYDGVAGLRLIEEVQPDIVVIDIQMPGFNGLEVIGKMREQKKNIQFIIISGYSQFEYARQALRYEVKDYLLKPVSFDRFLKSANRIHELLQTEQKEDNDYIFVKSDRQLRKILLRDILFIESMENYVVIQTASSKEVVYTTLKQLYESLPQDIFQQTHRSYIVNLGKITAIDGNQLIINPYKIPVAKSFKDNIFNLLLNNRLINRN